MAKPGFHKHRKFLRLVYILDVPKPHALGYVLCLWDAGYETGVAFVGDSLDVELAADYPPQDGKLTQALLEVGLIDEVQPGKYAIHDFLDHAPEYVVGRARKAAERARERECDHCGGPFRSGELHARFCSHSCRSGSYKRRRVTQGDAGVTQGDAVPRPDQTRPDQKEKTPLPPAGGHTPAPRKNRRTQNEVAAAVPIPGPLDDPAFVAAWGDWLADRLARRKPLTERAAREQLAKLTPLGPAKAAECVRLSIANGWTGIFPERFLQPNGTGPPGAANNRRETIDEKLARLQASGQIPT